MRERGLKLRSAKRLRLLFLVAPHAGAWIEMTSLATWCPCVLVAPHAGAWIEMDCVPGLNGWRHVAPHAGAWIEMLLGDADKAQEVIVAPHAGAWIEISVGGVKPPYHTRRSPCGSVD